MLVYKIMTDIMPGARVKLNSEEKGRRRANPLLQSEPPGSLLEAVGEVIQTMEDEEVAVVRWYRGENMGWRGEELGLSGVRKSALQKVEEPAGPTGVVKSDIGGGKKKKHKKRKKISKKRSSRKRTSRKSRRRRRR